MFALALVCSGLLAASPPPAGHVTSEEWKQYESAKAKAGRDPDAHVKLALWCEAHGLNAERTKHLTVAVLTHPKGTAARGLLGLVSFGGRWERPETVVQQTNADVAQAAALARYNAHRSELDDYLREDRALVERIRTLRSRSGLAAAEAELNGKLASGHAKLGLWCEKNGLKPEAVAHFTAAAEADPTRALPWEHLGYRKHKGRWMSQAQINAQVAEADAQRQADRHWERVLTRWRVWLADKSKRSAAEEHLATVRDPRAVPAIWRVYGQNEADEPRAAGMLSHIESPLATRGIVMLAVFGQSGDARRCAANELPHRDPRDVIPVLIDTIQAPVGLKVKIRGSGLDKQLEQLFSVDAGAGKPNTPRINETRGSQGELIFEGKRFDVARTFVGHGLPVSSAGESRAVSETRRREAAIEDENARGELIVEAQQARAMVDRFNAWAKAINARAIPLLQALTGQQILDDSDDWRQWWADQRGYVYQRPDPEDKPIFATVYQSPTIILPVPSTRSSCFAAGTPVRTLRGSIAIEEILVGDQVLAQDTKTGELGYRPVSAVRHNPPSTTLRIKIGDEIIVSTPIHRFWKAGSGWVMARDLKVGDGLRQVGGVTRVTSIEKDRFQPVFNLDVVGDRTFFVGRTSVLVHDHSLVEATTEPFDAAPTLR